MTSESKIKECQKIVAEAERLEYKKLMSTINELLAWRESLSDSRLCNLSADDLANFELYSSTVHKYNGFALFSENNYPIILKFDLNREN